MTSKSILMWGIVCVLWDDWSRGRRGPEDRIGKWQKAKILNVSLKQKTISRFGKINFLLFSSFIHVMQLASSWVEGRDYAMDRRPVKSFPPLIRHSNSTFAAVPSMTCWYDGQNVTYFRLSISTFKSSFWPYYSYVLSIYDHPSRPWTYLPWI